uniref:Interferon-induced GTP-binding protein Mx n=1 Tax=Myripristis murdjan TaxID=586833 RepID=A0A667YHN9_9TELE
RKRVKRGIGRTKFDDSVTFVFLTRGQASMYNTLNQQYEEKVRPCIDLIDSLRSLGVEKDLALPAIAVIGDQSSGKSSVLEALSGVALPRGSGIVTRCPLELKMKRTTEGETWQGTITYTAKKQPEAQNDMAGHGAGISEDLISLSIASPDVPDLTLIDLPGIARVAVKGQPQDIGEKIKKMIQKFIKKQETISLVVVPSNVDIATTEALKMAQEVDPDGERTLGILTKPDLVDKGTEATVVKTVHNELIPLKKGYMIVKCRGQQEILDRVSLSEAMEREKTFFEEHAYFSILHDEGQATIPKLAEKLTLELVNHIQRSLPQLEEQIEKKLNNTQSRLTKCGAGPPQDPSDKVYFFIDKVTAFTQDAISLAAGDELQCEANLNIFSKLRDEFGKWKNLLDSNGSNCKCITVCFHCEHQKYRGRELPGFINYKTFETMMKEQIKQLEEPAVTKLKDVADLVKNGFIQLAQCSFVGFPNLFKAAKAKIELIRKEKEVTAEAMLRTQFKMELVVYTQDSTYSRSLKRKREDEGSVPGFKTVNYQDNEATLKEMMLHLKSYYLIASQRLADQIPLVIKYLMLQESAAQLQREMLQMIQKKENVELMLDEDFRVNTERKTLQSRLNRLRKARVLLTEFEYGQLS